MYNIFPTTSLVCYIKQNNQANRQAENHTMPISPCSIAYSLSGENEGKDDCMAWRTGAKHE